MCDTLHVSKSTVIGSLHLLWWWALDYAQDGRLEGFTETQIARAMDWSGEAGDLVKAMIAVRFLDEHQGVLAIHGWDDYTLHYNLTQERRERSRELIQKRVKRYRKRTRNASVTQSNAATRPNQPNQPNQTKPEDRACDAKRMTLDDFQVTPDLEEWAQHEGIPQPGAYLDEFKDYWKGEGKVKKDWRATFRNRLRYLKEKGRLKTSSVWDSDDQGRI